MPILQQVLREYPLTYEQIAKGLKLPIDTVMLLAQGQGRLSLPQLKKLGELTHVDYRFWARRQDAYFNQ